MHIDGLMIPEWVKSAMIRHAEECLPEECCGLVVGQDGMVSEVIPVENVLHSPVEFLMDAGRQIHEMVRMEKDGLELAAIYHSHPNGPAFPSEKDLKNHMYPESLGIILSRNKHIWTLRGFKIHDNHAEEVPLRVG